jgi:hypothetical protein
MRWAPILPRSWKLYRQQTLWAYAATLTTRKSGQDIARGSALRNQLLQSSIFTI